MEPNYSTYSMDELNDVYGSIDQKKYPERFKSLCDAIHHRRKGIDEVTIKPELKFEKDLDAPIRHLDGEGKYVPNSISIGNRLLSVLFSLALLIYGANGIYTDDLYIPGKRGGIHFSGLSTWLAYAGIICLCVSLLSIIIDHYDKRDNEHKYYEFGKGIRLLGFILFLVAIVFNLIVGNET
jgi:hypothetical protein